MPGGRLERQHRPAAEQRDAVVGRVVLDRDYAGLADDSVDETAIRARVSRGLRALRIRLSGGRP